MIYLKSKRLFRDGKFKESIKLAGENKVNMNMVTMFLRSILTYVKSSDIEYREADKLKAKELLLKIEKMENNFDDEIK